MIALTVDGERLDVGRPAWRRDELVARIGLEVKQSPVDLTVGPTVGDRADRPAERIVVEHAPVDELRRRRVGAAARV